MNTESNIPSVDGAIPSGAVSVIQSGDGMEDFPVLKAFQQYVDAEQAKARKRMIQLCLFFAVLMTIGIAAFIIAMSIAYSQNQKLNDRLIEYAMHDREARVIREPQAPSQSEAAMKAMADSITAMQKELIEQQSRLAQEQLKMAQEAVKSANEAAKVAREARDAKPAPLPAADADNAVPTEKEKSIQRRLDKAEAKLKAEREALAKEKEALKEQEKQLLLRRLYPNRYDDEGNLKAADEDKTRSARKPRQIPAAEEDEDSDADTLSDLDKLIKAEEDAIKAESVKKTTPAVSDSKPAVIRNTESSPAPQISAPISYFEEEPIPEAKPANGMRMPVE